MGGPPLVDMLHGHHVIPIACGGEDHESNLALLCARCHAIAHRLGRMGDVDENGIRPWRGPQTAAQLLYEMALLRDERAWAAHVERGRPYVEPGDRRLTLECGRAS